MNKWDGEDEDEVKVSLTIIKYLLNSFVRSSNEIKLFKSVCTFTISLSVTTEQVYFVVLFRGYVKFCLICNRYVMCICRLKIFEMLLRLFKYNFNYDFTIIYSPFKYRT